VTAAPEASSAPTRGPFHPFFWAVLVLPFGLGVGYAQVAVPYVLRARGIDMAVVAGIAAVSSLPHAWKFVWAPALDAGWPRKRWFLLCIGLTAALLALTALIPPDPTAHVGPFSFLWLYTAVLTLAQATVATSSSAVLALMAVALPPEEKPRASGWQTAGNLTGTSAGGAVVTWLLGHTSPTTTAILLAATCLASALPIFFIVEPALPKHRLTSLVLVLIKDVWSTMKSRPGWTGLIICLSPVGTGAMTNLFSALATDYSSDPAAREHMVLLANGVGAGLVGALGALAGGYIAERMNLRVAYAVFGGVTALAAIGMILGPATPTAFSVGCLAYYFANGLCYTAFYAFVFEMIGQDGGGGAVTTKLALFVGASNLAISYVTWLDGLGYDAAQRRFAGFAWAGRAGMLGTDALSSFAGIALLIVMLVLVRRMSAPKPARAAA
jgi:MFS transporter, PAT family, beta-lactamase induction signal transducer AmpG